jgi:ketosteroid isomerase-like protein
LAFEVPLIKLPVPALTTVRRALTMKAAARTGEVRMTQPNQDLVRAASAAFGRGDLGALRDQFFAENIVWHVAGTGPLAGNYQGADRVMQLLATISSLAAGTVRAELHDVLVSNDHTVALATIRAERAGKQLQLNVVHVIHAENGKATEVWTHSSDPAAAAAFWS